MPRILITGGVGTGKTTLAKELSALLSIPILSTDDALFLPEVAAAPSPWPAANDEVARWMTRPGPWIIEGVRVPHALAIAIRDAGRTPARPFNPPLIYLTRAIHLENHSQAAMTASVAAAVFHCEGRLSVPTSRLHYDPSLASNLAPSFQ